ncbi:hypothetical protein Smp_150530 [Schistosoma mansoni]|uniref:Uncharacterized protein n=1 Tax=Schistosoma mansoni TaxID=6183 RepID=G4VK02_SCHMA|nr:hypothetical protein Smp_150530 [Schistosoma mansoni]|eukprot:XP_018652612.1 hypothetical protein Smp_150530 [Schistosoma mansoni]
MGERLRSTTNANSNIFQDERYIKQIKKSGSLVSKYGDFYKMHCQNGNNIFIREKCGENKLA